MPRTITSKHSQTPQTTSPDLPPPPPISSPPSTRSEGFPPIYGAVIGVSIAFLLLFATVIYLSHRRRKRRPPRHRSHRHRKPPQEGSMNDSIVILDVDGSTPSTFNTRRGLQEIDARVRPPESDGWGRCEMGMPECAVRVDRLQRAVVQMGF
ncbi:MAG: hypothetical protein Q9216_003686 [Gyalolechia sp. 2 TL-2023]